MTCLPRLIYIQPEQASPEGIENAYSHRGDFIPDSLMFTHKESRYVPGLSPLQLQWRDRRLSRFVIDTSDFEGERVCDRQKVVLRAKKNKKDKTKLKTWDGVTVCKLKGLDTLLGQDSECLVRLSIGGLDEAGCLLDVMDVKRVPPGRVFADSFSRIKSQAKLRKDGKNMVSIEALTQGLNLHLDRYIDDALNEK